MALRKFLVRLLMAVAYQLKRVAFGSGACCVPVPSGVFEPLPLIVAIALAPCISPSYAEP